MPVLGTELTNQLFKIEIDGTFMALGCSVIKLLTILHATVDCGRELSGLLKN